MRSLQVVPVAVLLLVFAVATTLPVGTGAVWVPIPTGDLSSRLVQQVARFAVLVHNLSRNANLVLLKVERGEIERPGVGGVGVGTKYRLELTAETSPGGRPWQYRCEVWGVPGLATWKLLSFKAI